MEGQSTFVKACIWGLAVAAVAIVFFTVVIPALKQRAVEMCPRYSSTPAQCQNPSQSDK